MFYKPAGSSVNHAVTPAAWDGFVLGLVRVAICAAVISPCRIVFGSGMAGCPDSRKRPAVISERIGLASSLPSRRICSHQPALSAPSVQRQPSAHYRPSGDSLPADRLLLIEPAVQGFDSRLCSAKRAGCCSGRSSVPTRLSRGSEGIRCRVASGWFAGPQRLGQSNLARAWRRLVVNGRTSPGQRPASTARPQASLASTSGLSNS